jgi:hypothetical protein
VHTIKRVRTPSGQMLPGGDPRRNDGAGRTITKAVVALANKNARILWAIMTKGEAFDARHVSVKPGAPAASAAPA